jgi:hypothetical protein
MKGCLLLLLLPFALHAAEKPAPPTGNARIDFFGLPPGAAVNGSLAQPLAIASPPLHAAGAYWQSGASGDKSPWIAGAMSLVVPGSGEIYSESYLKGGIFLAAEAAGWIVHFAYNKKGDDQEVLFKAYANEHYSAVRYVNWTLDNLTRLNPNPPYNEAQYIQKIYGGSSLADPSTCPPPFSCINWVELNNMEREVSSGVLNGYTHSMPYYGEQQYYELIGKYEQFSRGWDDSDPTNPLETAIPVRTTSKRQKFYADMRAQANDYYDVASTFAGVIVLNHIVSAIDAFWSATRFNSSLHANIEMEVQPTPLGYIPVTHATLRYDF